jgi:hypothetical protein
MAAINAGGSKGRQHVLADASLHQLAVEADVVGMTDRHHLGSGIADLGQRSSSAKE